jgi:hypothetical protein
VDRHRGRRRGAGNHGRVASQCSSGIAASLCLIEVFGHALDGAELHACLSKHFAHCEEHARKTRAQNKKRKEKDPPPEPVVEPLLWIIAAEVSAPILRKLKVTAARGWPRGVYFFGDDLFRAGIIVADRLPRTRSTLLVRIMAAGRGLPKAIAELGALPADAHERTVAEDVLVRLQHALAGKPSRTPEEEELIVKIEGNWKHAQELGRKEGRDEGRTEGRKEGRAEEAARAVLTALRVRGVAVPNAARERILAQKDPSLLERWLEKAIVAASLGEILDEPS